ncbi:hypothetical protein BGY98DRAFT_949780 [Russula aff. rugulosa BPL654]|nr:hypothetical protein BGY98DRAFT_949780 [Russula aff. rugulosa BPL654]
MTILPFHKSTIFSEITKAVRNKERLHIIPLARNFPAVDSILYDPNDPNAVLTCIQITLNKDHPIAGSDMVHHLKISAPVKTGHGALYSSCHPAWRIHSNCKMWLMTLAKPRMWAIGLTRCRNMY